MNINTKIKVGQIDEDRDRPDLLKLYWDLNLIAEGFATRFRLRRASR